MKKDIKAIGTKELDSLIAKIEGKISKVKIGDIREVRKIIDLLIKNNKSVFVRYMNLLLGNLQK